MGRMGKIKLQEIHTGFDFTTDCQFWNGFWDYAGVPGSVGSDPDSASKTLKQYHQVLWSKPLPNGEELFLVSGDRYDYLNTQDGLRLSSDTIVTSLMHGKMTLLLEEVAKRIDWKGCWCSILLNLSHLNECAIHCGSDLYE